MQFIVYCVRYTDRGWKKHRHVCSDQENEAVVDSAKAYALMRFPDHKLTFSDYLAGARYMFDVAFGPRDQPVIGDTVVTGRARRRSQQLPRLHHLRPHHPTRWHLLHLPHLRKNERLRMNTFEALALARLRQWSAERQALKNEKISRYLMRPGRPPREESHNRHDAALVRYIDFEREFGKLPTDTQTILLLAYREKQPQKVIAQITGSSPRALSYKLPAALSHLAKLLDKADLL